MPNRKSRGHRPDKDHKPKRPRFTPKTEGQKRLVTAIDCNDIIFCTGVAGTGKTTTSVATAVEYLNDKSINIEKILITRPIVESGRKIGYLPGTYEDKIHPYLRPVLDELDMYLGTENRKRLKDHGMIEICPVELMRGRNFHNTFMILDEAQNAEYKQVKSFLTRIGCNSVAVLNGDETQTDLPTHLAGGLIEALNKIKHVEDVEHVHLDKSDVVRSGIVSKIVEFL
jgi:phosphate starvation-inducible protein PhoH and related proteins